MKRRLSFWSGIILSIILCSSAYALDNRYAVSTGTVTGKLAVKGKGPMTGGMVFFFSEQSGPPPSATKYWRVPTHSFNIDNDGSFEAELPEGNYYMGASQKFSGEMLGPPKDGDYFFISSDAGGNPKLHEVSQFKNLDMGLGEEAAPFSSKKLVKKGITSIQGAIVDTKGKAVHGMLVFAFPTATMFGRPMYVSERTGKEGKYMLRVASGGKYYLRARAHYGGGPPSADQIMGVYAKGKALDIKTGEVKNGIDITVSTMGVPQ